MMSQVARRSGMQTRGLFPLLALLATVSAVPQAWAADAGCATQIASRVEQRYAKVRDLSAHFEQSTRRVALGGDAGDAIVARGDVVFAKPGKMRWSYQSPEPSLVVSDGSTLWIYDPAAREVQKLPLAAGYLSSAGVQFLLGDGRLREEFRVTAAGCGDPVITLVLVPKREAQYEKLELRVDGASASVRETTVVDLFGNRTTIAFGELRENTGPAASSFSFAPPEGVRVISVPSPN